MIAWAFSRDTREFLLLLAQHGVRYVIVGGAAVIYHGRVRTTGDVDIFYEPTKANATRLFQALKVFWAGRIPGIRKREELLEPRLILQFGFPPNRIDLMNSISGVRFSDAWKGRIVETFSCEGKDVPTQFIGLPELIANKRVVGRGVDKDDLAFLLAAKAKLEGSRASRGFSKTKRSTPSGPRKR